MLIVLFLIIRSPGCSKTDTRTENDHGATTTVVNLTNVNYDEYIGRGIGYHTHMLARGIEPGQEGWLGNPHPIGWCDICTTYHNRDECIEKFKEDFFEKLEVDAVFRNSVLLLCGKKLGCYCKPENCHGDIIKKWIDENSHPSTSSR